MTSEAPSRRWAAPSDADNRVFDPAVVFAAGLRNHHICNTAYPIAHESTWKPYRVGRRESDAVAARAWQGIDDLCLYVHVPFCHVRCSFCEYTVTKAQEHPQASEYVDALLREFDLYERAIDTRSRTLHGFDIGGGTPSFIPAKDIERIVERARAAFRFAEGSDISIETTPKIAAAEPDKLRAYKQLGVDRISMGVQVIQPDLLRVLNRDSGVSEHLRAAENIRAAGFERFNVDLMYGFRGQSEASWEATLSHAIELSPEYITLYRMRYKLTRISAHAPDVTLEHVRPLARLAKRLLHEAGYHANPGKTTYSRIPGDVGTSSYLARRVMDMMPYLGLGLGAQSFTHSSISYNDGAVGKNLAPYLRSVAAGRLPLQDLYDLPRVQMMAKACAVAFYFGQIELAPFADKFGISLQDAYPAAWDFVLSEGLMEVTPDALRLTPKGADHKSGVHALFHAPSIQHYLIERDPDAATDMHRNRALALRVAGQPEVSQAELASVG